MESTAQLDEKGDPQVGWGTGKGLVNAWVWLG